jgi:hypothetical protein
MQAAVRTILADYANDASFVLQRPMVRRRADNVFVASHANGRLFYRPYIGACQSTATTEPATAINPALGTFLRNIFSLRRIYVKTTP